MITALTIGHSNLGSNGEVAIDLLFALGCAIWGYNISRRHRILRGVTPWRLPSFAWALICLFLQPFGIIMELVAEFTTRPVHQFPIPDATPHYEAYPTATAVSEEHEQVALPHSRYLSPRDPAGKVMSFGWYSDVTKRHELRYFDGRFWSDHVADGGVVETDPLD